MTTQSSASMPHQTQEVTETSGSQAPWSHHAHAGAGEWSQGTGRRRPPAEATTRPRQEDPWPPEAQHLVDDGLLENEKLMKEAEEHYLTKEEAPLDISNVITKHEGPIKDEGPREMEDIRRDQPPRLTTVSKKYACSVQELLRWSEDETWGIT